MKNKHDQHEARGFYEGFQWLEKLINADNVNLFILKTKMSG